MPIIWMPEGFVPLICYGVYIGLGHRGLQRADDCFDFIFDEGSSRCVEAR
jgi:hypothetical protein